MPVTKVITNPRQMAEQLVSWLDMPEEEEEGYDGFDVDPYDSEREK